MTNISLTPRFRARVMSPRSVSSTESTVLTAVNSNKFLVATAEGVSDGNGTYMAYLTPPTGQRGYTDFLSCKRSIGSWVWRLMDKRTTVGGSNLNRWLTAFFGDATGRAQLLGLKWIAEVDWGDGNGWVAHSTGRIQYVASDDSQALWWKFTIREMMDDLHFDIFVGRPNPSNSSSSPTIIYPVGNWQNAWGPFSSSGAPYSLPFIVQTATAVQLTMQLYFYTQPQRLNYASWDIVTQALVDDAANAAMPGALPNARVVATWVSGAGALNGNTYHYQLAGVTPGPSLGLTTLTLQPLPATDPNYGALPAAGAVCQCYVLHSGPPTAKAPLMITNVHPAQLIKDILNGYFGYQTVAGAPPQTYAYNATAINNLIADTSFPTLRFLITQTWDAKDFIEQQILPVSGLGYYEDGTGAFVLYDARTPTSLAGLPTLATSTGDYAADSLSWQHGRTTAITQFTVTAYLDTADLIHKAGQGVSTVGGVQDIEPTLIVESPISYVFPYFGRLDMGQKSYTLDAQGLHYAPYDNDTVGNVLRSVWLQGYINNLVSGYARPFGCGSMELAGSLRRTATVTALTEGALVLMTVNPLPDPNLLVRAGTRLMRVTTLSPNADGSLQASFLDLGMNVVATVPTIGTPTQDATDTSHLADVAVTLNAASDPVDLWFNVTLSSVGTIPAANDPNWVFYRTYTASGTAVVPGAAGKRIWVRARSSPVNAAIKLPSAWAFPSGTGYVDLAALAAPSGLSVTPSSQYAVVTWTPGNTAYYTEISLDNFATRLALASPGTTTVSLPGLTASTGYTVYLRTTDLQGGVSSVVSQAFTTLAVGVMPTCPAMTGIAVLVGNTPGGGYA